MVSVQQPEIIAEATLEVVRAEGASETVPIDRSPFLIGRSSKAGNHLDTGPDQRVSRCSARVVYSDGTFRLEDRGQRPPGIFVNGERMESRVLQDGDVIVLGAADKIKLIFHRGQTDSDTVPGLLSRLQEAALEEPGTRDLRQLNVLLEATALLQARLPVREVLAAMLDRAIEITGADRGLLLESGETGELRPLLARRQGGLDLGIESITPSQTAIRRALEGQEVKGDAAELAGALTVFNQQLCMVAAIPLFSVQLRLGQASSLAARQLLGMLYLDSRRPTAFSDLQRKIVDALAVEAASLLDNARLIERERERHRLEGELSIARGIQQALLPKSFKRYPHFEVTAANRPCFTVGGDYYDLMEFGPDRTAFVIADVSGKGLGAALLATLLKGVFSGVALGQAAAPLFHHVNRLLCAHSETGRFATVFFGILDTSGQLEFINAGHLPAVLIRGGGPQTVCPAGSVPVGLLEFAKFETQSMVLQPGDTLVLVTDGITEAVDPLEEMFGADRLLHAAQRHSEAPVEELRAGILADVEEFSRGACQGDDMTLLIIRYLGPPQ
jgi:serine phosphatase RsbU (regulator of sigma subunit)